MVSLDAVGNTTKAVTKGFAIGSAVIAAVALFASFIETIAAELPNLEGAAEDGPWVFDRPPRPRSTWPTRRSSSACSSAAPWPFLFSSLAIRAVGRTAMRGGGRGPAAVRRRQDHGRRPRSPDYGPVIDICTKASLRELLTPALLAVLTPVIVGFGIGYAALGGFLAAAILTGQLMANFLSNAGGAWDNAKKYIEDGHYGGKGSESHKAAVIGDTVGDPFKDTAGPALNPLIKVMNLVSLLVLPAVISLRDNTGARYSVAGISLVILLASITYSKRSGATLAGDPNAAVAQPAAH